MQATVREFEVRLIVRITGPQSSSLTLKHVTNSLTRSETFGKSTITITAMDSKTKRKPRSRKKLPKAELLAPLVHEAWMARLLDAGVHSRRSPSGEELMVPYRDLSTFAQEMDAHLVQTVYGGIEMVTGEDVD